MICEMISGIDAECYFNKHCTFFFWCVSEGSVKGEKLSYSNVHKMSYRGVIVLKPFTLFMNNWH